MRGRAQAPDACRGGAPRGRWTPAGEGRRGGAGLVRVRGEAEGGGGRAPVGGGLRACGVADGAAG